MTVLFNMALHLTIVAGAVKAGQADLVPILNYIMVPVSLVLYFVNIRLSPSKLLFSYQLMVNYTIIITGVATFVPVSLLHVSSRSWLCSVLCLILYGLTWPLALHLYHSTAQQIYRIEAPSLWRIIWLIPTSMSVIILLFTTGTSQALVGSWPYLLARTSALVCVIVVYWVLVKSLEATEQYASMQQQLEFQTHLLDVQVEEQKKHSQLMVEHTQQIRQQRHDLRHQLTVIQSLAGEENQALNQYISELIQQLPSGIERHCENQAVSATVSHYTTLCQRETIDLTVKIIVPEQCEHINDSSLCVIFGNLLENAVEACRRIPQRSRFISLHSSVEHGVLSILMENTFDGSVKQENGRFRSCKRDDYGVGLSSIQAVAQKFQGDARFEADGTVFRSMVFLRL